VQPEPELLMYALALFPLAMISVSTSSLRAFEQMDLVWAISLANGIVQILAALFSNDLLTLCAYLLVGQLILAGFSFWICTMSLEAFHLFPIPDIRPLLGATLPFAALTILLVLSQRLGILSVSLLLNDSSTGLFSSVARVVDGLKLGHYAVLGALLPVISRGTRSAGQSFRSGFGLLMGLSLIMAVGLSLFPRFVILILFGDAFSQATGLLAILGWSLLPYTLSSFISYDLIARGKELTLVKATALSLPVFLVLYLWLISMYGLNGAIYATLAGEVFQAVILIYFRLRSGTTIGTLTTKESLK
jgi:O-antigen/teichoic acid export membrane protein